MAYETLTFRPSKKNKTLLANLAKLADKENRKLNNYIETVLMNHILAVKAVRQKKNKINVL